MPLENRLKEHRARLGINQADMGKRAGVSRQTISLIERGDYSPSVTLALKLAKICQVTVEDIFSYTEEENNEYKKKKNVYVKYAVIMCISGALGGILGGVMEMGHVHGVLTGIQEGMQFFLNSVRTWMLPLMAICGVIALVLCEQYMGRLKRAGEAMEQAEDEVYERLDYELEAAGSRGMIVSFVGSIAMILLLATGYSTKYIESLNGSGIMWFLLEILTFIALEVYLNVWQIRYVRVIQKIYPDKKGDPTSLKFPKQWLESCDEAEKECIYQASYKGYQTVMKWAPILTFVALILHMFFDTGILAIVMPSVIWLVTSVTYCRACLQNKGEKRSK